MEWNYLVIVISTISALFLVLMEVRRKARRNLAFRLLASVLAVAALALIAIPPTYQKQNVESGKRDYILLTPGYDKDSLSAFSNPVILATDKKLLRESGAKSIVHIPSIDYYLSENPGVRSIHVMGTGLPEEERAMLKNTEVRFHESGPAFGFQKVNWQSLVKSGDDLIIAGTFNNNRGSDIKIQLKGLSTILDSAIVSADGLSSFILSCTPRQLGKAINHLVVTSGSDTLLVEKIPFEVEPVKPLSILILSSAPDFEVNFLKQWLAENNFAVAMRSRISKGKFNTEFVNMDPGSMSLQSGALDDFDVLIADETSINQLGQSERSSLDEQVNNGLGLLIRNEEEVELSGSFKPSSSVLRIADQENISINIPGSEFQTVLPGRGINYLSPQAFDQPLVSDNKNRILVTGTSSGNGRILFSTISNTWFLKLTGNTKDYSSFWSHLLEKAARKKEEKHTVKVADRFPVVHEKARILVQSRSREIPKFHAGNIPIALKQNADLLNQWTGAYWPAERGWNTLEIAGDHKNFYVFDAQDWLSVRNSENTQATRQFALRSNREPGKDPGHDPPMREKIPPIYFYLILLVCCSYLWIETKFL